MSIKRYHLITMPSAQCHVEIFIDAPMIVKEFRLVSYDTTVLSCKPFQGGVDVEVCYPVNCSKTTARHVNRFTNELFGDNKYFDLKKLDVGQHVYYCDTADYMYVMAQEYERAGKKFY